MLVAWLQFLRLLVVLLPQIFGVQIVGHRGSGCSVPGCEALVPENTIAAFEAAIRSGVAEVELDVWMTADGEVVVVHGGGGNSGGRCAETVVAAPDFQLEQASLKRFQEPLMLRAPWAGHVTRDSSARGVISRVLARAEEYAALTEEAQEAAIREYMHQTNSSSATRWGQLPLFRDIMQQLCGRVRLQVEMKGSKPQLACELARLARAYPACISRVSTFQLAPESGCTILRHQATRNPDRCPNGYKPEDLLQPLLNGMCGLARDWLPFDLGLLYNDDGRPTPQTQNIIQWATRYSATWVHVRYDFNTLQTPWPSTFAFVQALQSQRLQVMLWWKGHSVDNQTDVQSALRAGVDALCVNNVAAAAQTVRRIGARAQ